MVSSDLSKVSGDWTTLSVCPSTYNGCGLKSQTASGSTVACKYKSNILNICSNVFSVTKSYSDATSFSNAGGQLSTSCYCKSKTGYDLKISDTTNHTCTYKDNSTTNMSFMAGDTDASAMVGSLAICKK